jgi:hypothetical protein
MIIPAVFSAIFAAMLFCTTYERYGTPKSICYMLLGAGIIWFCYFIWGLVFNHVYKEGIREGRRQSGK